MVEMTDSRSNVLQRPEVVGFLILALSLFTYTGSFFFFGHSAAYRVPGPGIRSEPQL